MTSPSKEFERLDRHIRTASTVRELAHWIEERDTFPAATRLTARERETLEETALDRAQELMGKQFGGKACR